MRIFVMLLAFLIAAGAKAQVAMPATGGEASGQGGTVSFTTGQIWYTVIQGNEVTLNQGIQQPYEIFEVKSVKAATGISLQCIVYPNPVKEYVRLKVDENPLEGLSYALYNMHGELLHQGIVTNSETSIEMTNYGSSAYFLKITREGETLKTYKIIKE